MRFLIIAGVLMLPVAAKHEGTNEFEQITGAAYSKSRAKVLNEKITYGWSGDEKQFFYQTEDAQGKAIVTRLDLTTNQESVVQEAVPKLPEERRDRQIGRPGYENNRSSDGKWDVILREGEVVLKDLKAGTEKVMAKSDEAGVFRGVAYWSPNSQFFQLWKAKEVAPRKVTYVRSSPEKQLQPETFTVDYPKPGDEITVSVPWIFAVDGSAPLAADQTLIPNPFSVNRVAWRGDSQRLTYEYIERGFGKYYVVEMNAVNQSQRVLIGEESKTFIYVYGYGYRRDLKGGDEILWLSERDGWNHLYLYDGLTGKVKKQLTKGEWLVKKVLHVDDENRTVLVEACGCYPHQDPYFEHYVMVHLDSGKAVPLTSADGAHERPVFSAQGNYYVCRWSRIDSPPVYELRRTADGKLIKTLAVADATELKKQWQLPVPFTAKDRDGSFDIFGTIIFPPDYDPAKKYPVVEYIYAGPQDAFVRKSWSAWLAPQSEVAAHGFITVQIDGRGTAHRGKKFHDECYKNLKDAGFPDRIAWMKAAAAKYPAMDLTRVGIFGGSAGGQNALGALLFHGDFYKAAAADCGCHDNRMDKIWWNEQWMDWPVGPEYADNSNVTHAARLQGALLLTVGELDTNVDPASTMQVANALMKADKDYEMIVVPGGGHGCGESRSMQRKRVDFFREHLMNP